MVVRNYEWLGVEFVWGLVFCGGGGIGLLGWGKNIGGGIVERKIYCNIGEV